MQSSERRRGGEGIGMGGSRCRIIRFVVPSQAGTETKPAEFAVRYRADAQDSAQEREISERCSRDYTNHHVAHSEGDGSLPIYVNVTVNAC